MSCPGSDTVWHPLEIYCRLPIEMTGCLCHYANMAFVIHFHQVWTWFVYQQYSVPDLCNAWWPWPL